MFYLYKIFFISNASLEVSKLFNLAGGPCGPLSPLSPLIPNPGDEMITSISRTLSPLGPGSQ